MFTNLPVSFSSGTARFGGDDEGSNRVSGFFIGDQATRAGMIYRMPGQSGLGDVIGAVGLQRGALTPSPRNEE